MQREREKRERDTNIHMWNYSIVKGNAVVLINKFLFFFKFSFVNELKISRLRSAWNEIWLNFCLKCYVVCTISSIKINSSQLSFSSMSGLCIFKKCLLSKIRAKLCRCPIVCPYGRLTFLVWSIFFSPLRPIWLMFHP